MVSDGSVRLLVALVGVLAGALTFASPARASAEAAVLEAPAGCDASIAADRVPNDYRLRERPDLRWNIADIKRNHYDPAVAGLRSGNVSRGVKADLTFILNWWPNHVPALEALVQYESAGGKVWDLPTAACYLYRARAAFPEDIDVMLVQAYAHWKRNEPDRAAALYEDVVRLDPTSLDAHYNLGLVYLAQRKFEKAREHAVVAYEGGYPLPGLRRKLASAGYPIARVAPPPETPGAR